MRRPAIKLNGDVGKVIDDIYSILNSLEDRLKSTSGTDGIAKPKDQEGSIKMIKDADGGYKLQVKFQDGWVESSDTAFTLKEV
jgi:hypothetical protein